MSEIFQGGDVRIKKEREREREKASDQIPAISIFKKRLRNRNPQKGN